MCLMYLTSSMALTQIREPPDVAQSHAEAHAGEQILGFVVPFGPVARLLLLHPLQLVIGRDAVFQTWVWNLHFQLNHSGGRSKLASAAAEMFALRCFRECAKKRAKKLSCSLLSLGFTPPIQPRKRGWDINSDLWYGSYQQLITVCFVLCNVSYFRGGVTIWKQLPVIHYILSAFSPFLYLNSVGHNIFTNIEHYSEKH